MTNRLSLHEKWSFKLTNIICVIQGKSQTGSKNNVPFSVDYCLYFSLLRCHGVHLKGCNCVKRLLSSSPASCMFVLWPSSCESNQTSREHCSTVPSPSFLSSAAFCPPQPVHVEALFSFPQLDSSIQHFAAHE